MTLPPQLLVFHPLLRGSEGHYVSCYSMLKLDPRQSGYRITRSEKPAAQAENQGRASFWR